MNNTLQEFQSAYNKLLLEFSVLQYENDKLNKEVEFYKMVVECEKTLGKEIAPREEGSLQTPEEKK